MVAEDVKNKEPFDPFVNPILKQRLQTLMEENILPLEEPFKSIRKQQETLNFLTILD
jgi:hypothetical protein